MQSILFVDDEPMILHGLKRMLHPLRKDWQFHFASSGEFALQTIEANSIDIIVSDMRMPGMDGSQLLAAVAQRFPDIARIILTGQSDMAMVMRSVKTAHSFLTKPCEVNRLKATLVRVSRYRDLLQSRELLSMVTNTSLLPCAPQTLAELKINLNNLNCDVRKTGEIIAKDIALTAKIVQLVSSAFFGNSQPILNPTEAAVRLGPEVIRELVFNDSMVAPLSLELALEFGLAELSLKAKRIGHMTRAVMAAIDADAQTLDYGLAAGILHPVGELIFIANKRENYRSLRAYAQRHRMALRTLEQQQYGHSSGEAGALLLTLWGVPEEVVEAVAHGADLDRINDASGLTCQALYIALACDEELRRVQPPLFSLERFVLRMGLGDRADELRRICHRVAKNQRLANKASS